MKEVQLYTSDTEITAFTAVGDFVTDGVDIFGKTWSFSITESGVDGTPVYKIESSNDLTTWYDYAGEFVNVAIDDAISEAITKFEYQWFRVSWTSTGVSTGTITFILTTNG